MSDLPTQLIRHMPSVQRCEQELRNLSVWWQRVTLVGKINSLQVAATLLDEMSDTKQRFETLQARLVKNLAQEKFNKLTHELGARSQVAIDILMRNLFERTADVGFLATDEDLRSFLRDESQDVEPIVERLREYTAKYSVYDEVIILDIDGRVRTHLDATNPIEQSRDPLIRQLLQGEEPYVEIFRPSDLQPKRRAAHIFAALINESNAPDAATLGILCLCFRFDDEMEGVFGGLIQSDEIISIIDDRDCVIASSNESLLPLGSKVEVAEGEKLRLVQYNGKPYLACTRQTNGYEGYYGLPWRGHVMQPILSAFNEVEIKQEDDGKAALLQHSDDELYEIRRTAALVTDDLTLAVMNGQIISAKSEAQEFIPVLHEIRDIGVKTRSVFDRSILNLHQTKKSSNLSDAQFRAFLAIDILDRNLYERANDVRWWALTSRFRELLAASTLPEGAQAELGSILRYINNLYTVYTNLLLFDTQGKVLAVSNQSEQELVGQSIADLLAIKSALEIQNTQQYTVSDFVASPLYGGRHSYIYMTSVQAPGSGAAVGGIAIVFDAEPQFRAILEDTLPKESDGTILADAFAQFLDRSGKIIASTRDGDQVGQTSFIPPEMLNLKNGERKSWITQIGQNSSGNHVVGITLSNGYREYKNNDGYSNDIAAVVCLPV